VSRVLIVGAGLAGGRCAETLRANGFEGELRLVGAEPVPPYERPALSKEHLAGTRDADSLQLRPRSFWDEREIELLLSRRVVSVDVRDRSALTDRGEELAWDALVLATGAAPRTLPGWDGPGVHVLRTLADAAALRERLRPGTRVAVVGAGFVGTEVASTALSLGASVTLVDVAEAPLQRVLGPEVGSVLAARYAEAGVELRLGAPVEPSELAADVVVVAVGVAPEAVAAAGANGIATDACGRTELPGVYAAGDVAQAWHPLLGRRLRVEHWTSAAGQGAAVAHAILGDERPHVALPYFWSDQFGLRLQYVGHTESWARVELEGEPDSFVARYRDEGGTTVAALAVNRPADVGALRSELAAGLDVERLAA
jgi:3-phenylpropionate/trans-cinnamate dioxygenase ferredoxin reductase subunit